MVVGLLYWGTAMVMTGDLVQVLRKVTDGLGLRKVAGGRW